MSYTKTHLEEFVEALYRNMNIEHPEQIDMELISRRLGILIDYIDTPSKSVYDAGFVMILINKQVPLPVQWQEFAHELAHILRHAGNQTLLPDGLRMMQEWQAEHFAAYFCVPGFMLEKIELPSSLQEAIPIISEKFNVMPWFAAARFNQWFHRYFF
ncbi:ImmA/IrrE family metallo-endopeptidase [Domibacillus sp.]|uniref:ImmA/IrrE family metallo-endopeptidase n=1 Tax=Domibacillus sp. TaxID=1969783 RepID=UPI00281168DA|nr:ImmA/IrrE family metallo-endopeptidase [Domibacillus sp.]